MIRLGLRLTLASGHEAALRVLVTAAAVALGVGLLLAALAGWQRSARADRPWCVAGHLGAGLTVNVGPVDLRHSVVAVQRRSNSAARQSIVSTLPPPDRTLRSRRGSTHLPGPGEYFASPALATLIASQPANELRDRFPGRENRDHRRRGTSVPELADHRHRPHRPPALGGTWCGRGGSHPAHAGQLLPLPEPHRERTRSAVDPGRRSRLPAAAGAHLDRDCEPAVGRTA